ncbi:hypothetical protein GCM10009504_21750 [Pseudomonas laurentiana]|nr:hypothetical protein GCM10009504_21750 [Pseudomonas laurentiana]
MTVQSVLTESFNALYQCEVYGVPYLCSTSSAGLNDSHKQRLNSGLAVLLIDFDKGQKDDGNMMVCLSLF